MSSGQALPGFTPGDPWAEVNASTLSNMNLGELEAITMWPAWEWFGTLTFRGTPPGHGKAKAMALNYLFRVARLAKVRFSSLVWVLREEEGEQGGRRHFHFLLSGT